MEIKTDGRRIERPNRCLEFVSPSGVEQACDDFLGPLLERFASSLREKGLEPEPPSDARTSPSATRRSFDVTDERLTRIRDIVPLRPDLGPATVREEMVSYRLPARTLEACIPPLPQLSRQEIFHAYGLLERFTDRVANLVFHDVGGAYDFGLSRRPTLSAADFGRILRELTRIKRSAEPLVARHMRSIEPQIVEQFFKRCREPGAEQNTALSSPKMRAWLEDTSRQFHAMRDIDMYFMATIALRPALPEAAANSNTALQRESMHWIFDDLASLKQLEYLASQPALRGMLPDGEELPALLARIIDNLRFGKHVMWRAQQTCYEPLSSLSQWMMDHRDVIIEPLSSNLEYLAWRKATIPQVNRLWARVARLRDASEPSKRQSCIDKQNWTSAISPGLRGAGERAKLLLEAERAMWGCGGKVEFEKARELLERLSATARNKDEPLTPNFHCTLALWARNGIGGRRDPALAKQAEHRWWREAWEIDGTPTPAQLRDLEERFPERKAIGYGCVFSTSEMIDPRDPWADLT